VVNLPFGCKRVAIAGFPTKQREKYAIPSLALMTALSPGMAATATSARRLTKASNFAIG
jgi:hypothetical protein